MPKFNVLVTVDVTQSAVVPVEAEDRDTAIQLALEEARSNGSVYEWSNDDCGGSWKPYIADHESAAEEVFACTACGRDEAACSALPCAAVLADREA